MYPLCSRAASTLCVPFALQAGNFFLQPCQLITESLELTAGSHGVGAGRARFVFHPPCASAHNVVPTCRHVGKGKFPFVVFDNPLKKKKKKNSLCKNEFGFFQFTWYARQWHGLTLPAILPAVNQVMFNSYSAFIFIFFVLQSSLYTIKAVLVLDTEGKRLIAKYYSYEWSQLEKQLAFEKNIVSKAQVNYACTASTLSKCTFMC